MEGVPPDTVTGGYTALTDTAAKNTKHSGKPAGDKLYDTGGLYLLVKAVGRYWRMDYRFAGKYPHTGFFLHALLAALAPTTIAAQSSP